MKFTEHVKSRYETMYQQGETPWIPEQIPDFVEDFAKRVKKDFSRPKALDFGCGNGWLSLYLAKLGFQVVGIDSSKTAIRLAKTEQKRQKIRDVKFISADALNFSHKKNFFDVVVDRGLLHHIPLSEYARYKQSVSTTLKQGGLFALSVFSTKSIKRGFSPSQSGKKWHRFKDRSGYWGYDRFFTKEDIARIFKKEFEILKITEDRHRSLNGSQKLNIVMRKRVTKKPDF